MAGALEGIRVIDCGVMQLGPTAATLLGDLGADVVKVEPPVTGEIGRGIEALTSAASRINARGSHFEIWNRNKRSMTLDLTKEPGREAFYRLAARSDVVLNNWRQGVAERLKVDYDTLIRYNPKIIFAHSSSWGPRGPESSDQAMDFAAMARSGMAYQVGNPGDPPAIFISGFADTTAGFILSQGILAALVLKERKGIGQKIETSLLGSVVAGLERLPVNSVAQGGHEMPRRYRAKSGNPLWNYYRCLDGGWIALGMLAADTYWSSFCQALAIQSCEHDPRFSELGVRSVPENSEALISILDGVFATKTKDEWIDIMRRHKLICTRVQTLSDLFSDPQVIENGYIMDYDHPVYGRIKTVGFPWEFSATPATLRLPAPELGQHTEEVLLELGYTWDDISRLRTQEAI